MEQEFRCSSIALKCDLRQERTRSRSYHPQYTSGNTGGRLSALIERGSSPQLQPRELFIMLASAFPPPSSPLGLASLPASAAEIEKTPWLAEPIEPTWLPESAAKRSAEARAFRVASVITSGFSALRPPNL